MAGQKEPQLASESAGTEDAQPTDDAPADDEADAEAEGEDDGDDDDQPQPAGAEAEGGADDTAKAKKKRKPKKKKKKAADATAGASTSISTELQAPSNSGAPQKPPVGHDMASLLQQLALSPPGKSKGKAPEDYKFWNTQPVPKFREPNLLQTTSGANGEALPEGPILPDAVCKASVKPEPEKLVDGFEWCVVDLEDKDELKELYELLYGHYVEDVDGSFRFNYSTQFLAWALKPPGWRKDWHIGVRTKPNADGKRKLVAFIAGIPVTLQVRDATIKASEINFLTIHRKLRAKRLAPVLIKEVTRRCYENGVYQALYTAGTLLPTPISTCRYYHRSLDWEHLYKVGFAHLPPHSSELRQKLRYKLESSTSTKGLRPMGRGDVGQVRVLLERYLKRFHLRQEFDEEDIEHWFCSEASKGVVWAYVVEGDGGKITDFMSYYLLEVSTPFPSLPFPFQHSSLLIFNQRDEVDTNASNTKQSTVLRNSRNEEIRAAYLYYYATDAAFKRKSTESTQSILRARLEALMHDMLILAKRDNFHVFNAVSLLDNPLFLTENKFLPGDGSLHYYLFNWRTGLVPGGINEANALDASKTGGVGVVML
ncbi:hypothetical protein LTR08_000368 [Meristemomyces frigidus]|nr:hypothetical protein LTR08_000368 [Meristemomyces frigidus]